MEDPGVRFNIQWPDEKSVLIPVPGFEIHFSHTKPNWFWRMWQFFLLGWRWRNLKMKENKNG